MTVSLVTFFGVLRMRAMTSKVSLLNWKLESHVSSPFWILLGFLVYQDSCGNPVTNWVQIQWFSDYFFLWLYCICFLLVKVSTGLEFIFQMLPFADSSLSSGDRGLRVRTLKRIKSNFQKTVCYFNSFWLSLFFPVRALSWISVLQSMWR